MYNIPGYHCRLGARGHCVRLAISITGVGSLLKPWYKRFRRAILLLMSFFSVKSYLEEDKDLLLFQLITALGERIPRVDIPAKGMSSKSKQRSKEDELTLSFHTSWPYSC